jgi:hypothetical protein
MGPPETSNPVARPFIGIDGSALARQFDVAARAAGGPFDAFREIAGRAVRFRFASTAAMERLLRSFEHLPESVGAALLTIEVWETSVEGTTPPLPALPIDDGAPGAVVHYRGPTTQALFQPNLNALSVLEEGGERAWYWAESFAGIPEWEVATPFRHVLHWWLSARGVQQLHAAAVGTASGGVLIVGKGGSGKSTVALASLASELIYAGDDYVAVAVEQPFAIHSLYSSAKLDPASLDRLPHLSSTASVAPHDSEVAPLDREKTVFYVHETWPGRTTAGFPLRAVVVPHITGGDESVLRRISAPRALGALAPSTIVQLHTAGSDALSAMARVVAHVPCFALDLGSNPGMAVDKIHGLLHDLENGAEPSG